MTEAFHTVELSDPRYEHEGLRLATVKSRALGARADVSVWVPPAAEIDILLILLHGVYGSHWVWSQKAQVHRTAQQMLGSGDIAPMVIAMPSDGLKGDGSGYLTYPGGEDFERWIIDEVPAVARLAAPALRSGAKIAIGGLSMGGYGALRLGAKYAERFNSISAHSAITDVFEMLRFVEEPLSTYLQCGPPEELSVLYWLRRHRAQLPKIRMDCGLQDDQIEPNRRLHEALKAEGIAHTYEEHAGAHDWAYWQAQIAKTLLFASEP